MEQARRDIRERLLGRLDSRAYEYKEAYRIFNNPRGGLPFADFARGVRDRLGLSHLSTDALKELFDSLDSAGEWAATLTHYPTDALTSNPLRWRREWSAVVPGVRTRPVSPRLRRHLVGAVRQAGAPPAQAAAERGAGTGSSHCPCIHNTHILMLVAAWPCCRNCRTSTHPPSAPSLPTPSSCWPWCRRRLALALARWVTAVSAAIKGEPSQVLTRTRPQGKDMYLRLYHFFDNKRRVGPEDLRRACKTHFGMRMTSEMAEAVFALFAPGSRSTAQNGPHLKPGGPHSPTAPLPHCQVIETWPFPTLCPCWCRRRSRPTSASRSAETRWCRRTSSAGAAAWSRSTARWWTWTRRRCPGPAGTRRSRRQAAA